jgi:NAD(P)-dependent dehydrogenase (short-subunit alcohol dehydrogenase family)
MSLSRVFLVTGGASGLGEATVRHLVSKMNAKVIIADIAKDKGSQVVSSLPGQTSFFAETDVTDADSVTAAIEAGMKHFRADTDSLHFAGAVACAGIAPGEAVISSKGHLHRPASFARALAINTTGAFNVLRAAAGASVESAKAASLPAEEDAGVVILTSSIAATEGQRGQVAYAASKGAVQGMILPAARDLARSRVRVVGVAPGLMDTPMMAGLPDSVRTDLAATVPYPSRLGHPAEFGSLVGHIVENQLLNGTTIRLDGALRMV